MSTPVAYTRPSITDIEVCLADTNWIATVAPSCTLEPRLCVSIFYPTHGALIPHRLLSQSPPIPRPVSKLII